MVDLVHSKISFKIGQQNMNLIVFMIMSEFV